MIRRGFWLTAGAVTGIYGYRRASAVARRLSASLNPAGPGVSLTGPGVSPTGPGVSGAGPGVSLAQRARLARRGRRGAVAMARETYRFSRDVREGMELYWLAHPAPAGSTLSTDRSTDHDVPKDGH
jgi:hypothetical protein